MNKSWINILFIAIIAVLSFYLRIDAYLINNSFFQDEVILFANIFSLDYLSLIKPYSQVAPYFFLVISKFIASNIGITELCLRFIPLLSSLLSVIMFYKLSKIVFKTNFALYIAIFTFGINYQLLFYSQAFKQYSTDVLIVILFLYYVVYNYNKLSGFKHFTILGLLSTIGIYFSFPMLLVIPAVYLALCILKRTQIFKIIYSLIYPILGLIIYYVFNIRFLNNSEYLHNYWQKGFQIFNLEFYKMNFDFLFTYYTVPILLVIMLLFGFYYLYKNNKFLFLSLLFIIFDTLLAAYLKIYPCERRLILFLLPIILIIAVYPLDNLKKDFASYFIFVVSCVFLLNGYFNFGKNYIFGNISYVRQDVKPLLEIISQKSNNENVYIYYGAISTYSYYSMIQNLPKAYFATYPEDENLSEEFLVNDLNNLPKGVYNILFVKGSNTYERDLVNIESWIKEHYKILDTYKLKSAALFKIIIY